jgi:hypothetical protein
VDVIVKVTGSGAEPEGGEAVMVAVGAVPLVQVDATTGAKPVRTGK